MTNFEDIVSSYREPHADQRQLAAMVSQMFNSYLEVGFTRDEALDLVKFGISMGQKGK